MVALTTTTFGLGSVILNSVDSNGVIWRVAQNGVTGLGSTESTIQPVPKVRGGGSYAGDAFHASRSITFTGTIQAPNPGLLLAAEDQLHAAVTLTSTPLLITQSGVPRTMFVRRDGEVMISRQTNFMSVYTVSLVALDWRKFGTPLTGTTLLPVTTGGLTVPFTVPFPIASTVVSGQVLLTNTGNETGPVVMRVDGPCTGPQITHVGSAAGLTFSSSLVLNAGEWLTIDMEKKSVLANDQANRSSYITSRGWSGFDPGPNLWSFTAIGYDPASRLTVTATPANK